MKPEFSIIVPVFNSEKTIVKCLESLKKQTLKSFEVLVIDDGSVDKSGEFCDQIAKKDKRFKVIHQKNLGVSYARNVGLAMARGDYIAFVDSDDTVELNYLEYLKKEFESSGADVVFLGYKTYSKEGKVLLVSIPQKYNTIFELQISELSSQNQFGYTWAKVFKNTVLKEHSFRKNISLFEDEIFTCEVLNDCHVLSVVDYPIYHYVVGNDESLTGKVYQDYCELQEQVYLAWKKLISGSEYSKIILEKKADELASTFQYYLYERDINLKSFLKSASKCTFIKESTLNSSFFKALKKEKWYLIKCMRFLYLNKIKIFKILHR